MEKMTASAVGSPTYRRHNSYDPRDGYQGMYPQYYGGFHARYLQNYGYPTGDLGFRGMAW